MPIATRLRPRTDRASTLSGSPSDEAPPTRKVLILSANVGEGHAAAARALAQHVALDDPSVEVSVIDGLAAMGNVIRHVVQDGYETQLRVAPWSADIVYWLLLRLAPVRLLARTLLWLLGSRSLQRTIAAEAPDVVVSTYPAVTVVLGMLRRRGRLPVPSVAAITDMAGLFFWADRGVDLHLLAYEESLPEVERVAGRGCARAARGLVAPHFEIPRDSGEARAALGIDLDCRLVIVSGGGWGVGDLAGAIREALSIRDVRVVVLAGRNEELRAGLVAEFGGAPRVEVLGFTTQIDALLAAADAMVHSTAGVTCLEARERGCPVVVYGAQIAHIRVNARAMARERIVDAAVTPAELRAALERALAGEGAVVRPTDAELRPHATELLAGARIRVPSLPRWRLQAPRVAVSLVASMAPVWTFVSPSALGLHTINRVPTHQRAVVLLVRAPSDLIGPLRARLRAEGMDASFAVGTDRKEVLALQAAGAHGLPELNPGGTTHWLHTSRDLHLEARALGLTHRHFFYLRPRRGFSLAEYVLASRAGGRAVSPRELPSLRSGRPLHAGDVIVVNVARDNLASAGAAVERAHAQLAGSGLSAVALDTLASS